MGSMEASTAPENGSAAAGGAGNGAGAASNGGGVERRLRSSAAPASCAAQLPLEVGTRVMCRWRDQKLHPVKVIERRKGSASSSPADYEYYVHYTECKSLSASRLVVRMLAVSLGLGFVLFGFGEFWPCHATG
jgi:histone acetyltransferase MYST1